MSCPRNLTMKIDYLAGASDLPHSRQEVLARGVINPQNGHILCDAKPRTGGVTAANRFETAALVEASRLRKRSRNWRRTRSISGSPYRLSHCQPDNDIFWPFILCKIAHNEISNGLAEGEQCRPDFPHAAVRR